MPEMLQLRCSPSKRASKEYPLFIGTRILDKLYPLVSSYQPDKVIIISDTNVAGIYGGMVRELLKEIPSCLVAMPAGEAHKTPEVYLQLCGRILQETVTKKSFILILGGGVPGNVGGFAASTLMRGLKFAHLPTTIVAQADSTTGGKQGVNTIHGKNLLGVFNDPEFVLIDTEFLKTLPLREIRGGLAECIKHALCQDTAFVSYLFQNLRMEAQYSPEVLNEIILRTLKSKLEVLRYDPQEINEGKVLVYGHTVGHALETLANYALTHGEAISVGMLFAACLAAELGICPQEIVETHRKILLQAGLPVNFPPGIGVEDLLRQLRYDKKYAAALEFVLLRQVGEIYNSEGRVGMPVGEEMVSAVCLKHFGMQRQDSDS